jgi:hypothetical protein
LPTVYTKWNFEVGPQYKADIHITYMKAKRSSVCLSARLSRPVSSKRRVVEENGKQKIFPLGRQKRENFKFCYYAD